MNRFLTICAAILLITSLSQMTLASSEEDFMKYMQVWDEKRDLASKYLEEAESEFKAGDELSGCASQQKAAEYGIDATNALLKAMKMNSSADGIENIESGLRKWQELRDFC
ncbi:hypothetical protein [Prochlorococcus sp. MIT 1341]|uniref:hypothetical protein n=1 Tax=Prochlorococcus sp. MIT 1341 TaxID=3096221 RepID=UPI002A74B1A2|nr:hypothetical protein [Prochlorococcus sp. MIT 1341]